MSASSPTSLWYPPSRIATILTRESIVALLPPSALPRLVSPLSWGEGLTSETYLDWILTKSGRLFLILADVGIPERIFALVDASVDDVDLPFSAKSVQRLHLASDGEGSGSGGNAGLNDKFFHAQWRFTVRGIAEGEHIHFTPNEGVPVELQRTDSALAKEGVEKAILAGAVCRVLLRTQVTIAAAPHFFEEAEVLEEIRCLRRLAHPHVFSIFASYFVDRTVCILFDGCHERTLGSFLADQPLPFKRLPKAHRRRILVTWPLCLARGLAWLHAHGHPHRALRPSNVLVDKDFRIFLGQFEALDTLLPPLKVDDVEAYTYGAPERWSRSTVQDIPMQTQTQRRLLLPSGGRTARRPSSKPGELSLAKFKPSTNGNNPNPGPGPNPADGNNQRSNSLTSQDTIRLNQPYPHPHPHPRPQNQVYSPGHNQTRFSLALSTSSSSSSSTSGDASSTVTARKQKRILPSLSLRKPPPVFHTPSIASSSSSSGSSTNRHSTTTATATTMTTTTNTPTGTIIQTWHTTSPSSPTTTTNNNNPNTNHNTANTTNIFNNLNSNNEIYKEDIYLLASLTLDILSTLHSHTPQKFSTHRRSKNRTPGRGGSPADASFHLPRNYPQVLSWIAMLEREGEKRSQKAEKEGEEGARVFMAGRGLLNVVRGMLVRESGGRLWVEEVVKKFEGVLREVGIGECGCCEGDSTGRESGSTPATSEPAEDVPAADDSLPESVDYDTSYDHGFIHSDSEFEV